MMVRCCSIMVMIWCSVCVTGILVPVTRHVSGHTETGAGTGVLHRVPRGNKWSRVTCPRIRVRNGRIRIRANTDLAKFSCRLNYRLIGVTVSHCINGTWSEPPPVCVKPGCPPISTFTNGVVTSTHGGAYVRLSCMPGYRLYGSVALYCNGWRWNGSIPMCQVKDTYPSEECDFESADLCGWEQDPTHEFDWTRNNFATPSGYVQTGPHYDHTLGANNSGYYMYTEASNPRRHNDSARLFSPVYPANRSDGCFHFYYHMYGGSIGSIKVYQKPVDVPLSDEQMEWQVSGNQGDQWMLAEIQLRPTDAQFQMVIEGIRGHSYLSDIAIDDVAFTNYDCVDLYSTVSPAVTGPVDGGYSEWSWVTHCSRSCGPLGLRSRMRTCTEPPPAGGGRACPGASPTGTQLQVMTCNRNVTCPAPGGPGGGSAGDYLIPWCNDEYCSYDYGENDTESTSAPSSTTAAAAAAAAAAAETTTLPLTTRSTAEMTTTTSSTRMTSTSTTATPTTNVLQTSTTYHSTDNVESTADTDQTSITVSSTGKTAPTFAAVTTQLPSLSSVAASSNDSSSGPLVLGVRTNDVTSAEDSKFSGSDAAVLLSSIGACLIVISVIGFIIRRRMRRRRYEDRRSSDELRYLARDQELEYY